MSKEESNKSCITKLVAKKDHFSDDESPVEHIPKYSLSASHLQLRENNGRYRKIIEGLEFVLSKLSGEENKDDDESVSSIHGGIIYDLVDGLEFYSDLNIEAERLLNNIASYI